MLDHVGGPNHLGNVCDAPIHAADRAASKVTVQSYYDVIGHFSRHAPPGSVRVASAARGAFGRRAARKAATRAAVGFELTLAHCEGAGGAAAPRQAWTVDPKFGYLELVDATVADDWHRLCVGDGEQAGEALALVNCEWGKEHGDVAVGVFEIDGAGRVVEKKSKTCLGPAADLADLDGAPLVLGHCGAAPTFVRTPSGALVADDGRCATAGWPFLQATAFARPDGATAVVVVNEADAAATFELDVDGSALLATAPAHSVQTWVVAP